MVNNNIFLRMKKFLVFMMLLMAAVMAQAQNVAQAIYCADAKTMYFTYQPRVSVGSTFDGHTVSKVWSGEQVTDCSGSPDWTMSRDIDPRTSTKVKFDNSFINVKPKNLDSWFWGFQDMTTIEGIEFLNTSEAKSIASMFHVCEKLKTIDLNYFDVSKVEDISSMFYGCQQLETIYCNQSWNIEENESMFWACNRLKNNNGVTYDRDNDSGDMACPFTGYFTANPQINGKGTEAEPFEIASAVQWDVLAGYVNSGRSTDGIYFKQTADFKASSVVGDALDKKFNGVYDGNYHALLANIEKSSEYTALFGYVGNATVENLFVGGTVKGGGHSAMLVGYVAPGEGSAVVENCNVVGTVSTTSGDNLGGIVGYVYDTAELTVSGCVFSGTIKRDASATPPNSFAGAIVGVSPRTNSKVTVKDCFEKGTYTNFGTMMMLGNSTSSSDNYNTHNWGDGSSYVLEVTDETEGLIVPVVTGDKPVYGTSLMVTDSGVMAQIISEIEEREGITRYDIESDVKIYAVATHPFTFTSPYNISAKNTTTGGSLIVFQNQSLLTVTMPTNDGITIEAGGEKAYAIWCQDAKTLFFDVSKTNYSVSGTYTYNETDYTISGVWSGSEVTDVGWALPKWADISEEVTKVVFVEDFKNVKPKSLYAWFFQFYKLKDIEGIEYLNTSECTIMNSTFSRCYSLEKINVDGFDMSKVTNTSTMFYANSDLKTIYCSKNWNTSTIKSSLLMFGDCVSLKGARAYRAGLDDITMADPDGGYFTTTGKAHVIWCSANKILYFVAPETEVNEGDTYEDRQLVTRVWQGDDVVNVDAEDGAPWSTTDIPDAVKRVVIDKTFASITPTCMKGWFKGFSKITEIEGLEYLNTSEATDMTDMFHSCKELTSLDLRTFDMSKVTRANGMFYNCEKLKTIICDDPWNISAAYGIGMFMNCSALEGAINYGYTETSSIYANPLTGYFTTTDGKMSGRGTESDPIQLKTPVHWNAFAKFIAAGKAENDYSEGNYLYYKLMDNIKIGSHVVGTNDHPFYGDFDGNGFGIEVDIESEDEFAAPFRYAGIYQKASTRIRNLVTLGKVETSEKFAGGIVGYVAGGLILTGCQSAVELNSTVDGDGSHGGLIGYCAANSSARIEGCVFSGKLIGEKTKAFGGIVGWRHDGANTLTLTKNLFAPEEVKVKNEDNKTLVRYNTSTTPPTWTKCYYTKALGNAQGNLVYQIGDDDEYLALGGGSQSTYTASRLTVDNDLDMLSVKLVDELEDDDELDGDYYIYAKAGTNVKITSELIVEFKKASDDSEITTTGSGTEGSPYTFTMPADNVEVEFAGMVPYAIWCDGNKTLYFTASGEPISGEYDGQSITAMWSGGDVISTGWSTPKWHSPAAKAEKVVFTQAFSNMRPSSLNRWFWEFGELEDIEGIENLNTSEVTIMNSMFFECKSITRLDLDGFDISKKPNVNSMFNECKNLKTIFCNTSWTGTINTEYELFLDCDNLEGAVKYDFIHTGGGIAMANPNNGLFTKKELTLKNGEDNTDEIEKFDGIKNVKVKFDGRTFNRTGYWNTVVLPFDLTIDDTEFDKEGVTIRELDTEGTYGGKCTGYNDATGTLYLYFKDVNEMKAGVPYIIKWYADDAIVDPEFTGVTINAKDIASVVSTDGKVKFIGSYSPVTLEANNKENLYLGSRNNLIYPTRDVSMNSCRAYFNVDLGGGDVNSLKTNFEEEATGVNSVHSSQSTVLRAKLSGERSSEHSYYTLDGRKVNGEPKAKGIYVNKGVKVVR